MTYIIGVDHLIQYNNGIVPEEIFREFAEFLKEKSRMLNINLIAEEFSEEALYDVYCATTATVKKAAGELGIEHRFCDVEDGDRKKLGIPYYADIRDSIKKKYNITDKIIPDHVLGKKIEKETSDFSKTFWGLREEFWFNKISDSLDKNILFICGHEHVERFAGLITQKGSSCSILDLFWKNVIFSDYDKLFSS
ncbi:MAG: hypothetical protein JXN64_10235 [Spirochaetes bacterium]|nr:hypothetical protein [Spirochaetota bacterium]